jgi:nucleotide-binding universal stress UspA family protein
MTHKMKTQPILVPVDFSPCSEEALLYAADLAAALQFPLIVLHVVHDPGQAPGYYAMKGRKKQLRRMEDVAAEMMEEFMLGMKRKHPDHPTLATAETSLVVGLPVTRILETAAKVKAGMIVMGSQGRTGLAHVLLGSKSEQVVRLSPIPVTIVKAKAKAKTKPDVRDKK